MKVATLSESPADEAILHTLIDATIGEAIEPSPPKRIRTRGWPAVYYVLPAIIRELHYHSDADGLVVVVDSNGSTIHDPAHDACESGDIECRLCQMRGQIQQTCYSLARRIHRPELRIAIGLAVPSIEAWCLCGTDPTAKEVTWLREQAAGAASRPYILKLKTKLYCTERPSIAIATERGSAAMRRVVGNLSQLESCFPNGFGPLAKAVRSWRSSGGE